MNTSEHKPTIEETQEWDEDELLKWIQQKRPKLLKGDKLEKFKAADIPGKIFLKHAGDTEFFKKECNLTFGVSETLANLAAEVVGMEAVGLKSKLLFFIPCTSRRQEANKVTGYRQQAKDTEISDTASKKPRRESEANDPLQELAISAHQQRERIRQVIEKLDQSSVPFSEDAIPLPNSVFQLSNPTFHTKLPFPFIGHAIPRRFQINIKDNERNWFYMGREKFTELRKI